MKKIDFNKPKETSTEFKIPSDYFDRFETVLMDRIAREKPKPKASRIKLFIPYVCGAAAAAVVWFALVPVFHTDRYSKLDLTEVETYLQYQTTDLGVDVLNELETDDLDQLENKIPLDKGQLQDYLLTHVELENYIEE